MCPRMLTFCDNLMSKLPYIGIKGKSDLCWNGYFHVYMSLWQLAYIYMLHLANSLLSLSSLTLSMSTIFKFFIVIFCQIY